MLRGFLLAVLVGCSAANKDWRAARRAGTAEAYRPIANDFGHPKRAKAYERVERLDWERGESQDSSRAWKAYLSHHPNSPRANEARKRRDEARWNEVVQADSRTTFEAWLGMNGSSPHAAEARQRIAALGWQEAQTENTVDGYARYIVRNPNGPYVDAAKEARETLYWDQATRDDRPAAYRAFLERYPDGLHAGEARAVLDGFRFSGVAVRVVARKVLASDSLATYQAQLERSLIPTLEASNLATAWLEPVDAVGPGAVNPLAGLLTTVPEDHAALVIEVREQLGAPLEPSGHLVEVLATVHLVPPGRTDAMDVREVRATTEFLGSSARERRLDAQRVLGDAILAAGFGFETWRR
jgi:hypothetical protein